MKVFCHIIVTFLLFVGLTGCDSDPISNPVETVETIETDTAEIQQFVKPPTKMLTGSVKVVLSLPVGENPEGITVDNIGNLYIGTRKLQGNNKLSEIIKIDRNGNVSVFANLPATSVPEAEALLGLTTDRTGNLYAAFASFDPATQGVWRISRDGSQITRLEGSENLIFPNGLVFDRNGNLYATDSFTGSIWRYGRDETFSLWLSDDLLAPASDDPFGFPLPGANGITFDPPNNLYVANTEKGLVAKVTIEPDGSASGPFVIAQGVEIATIDGLTVDVSGTIFGAIAGSVILGTSPIVKIHPVTGAVTQVVTEPADVAAFDIPTSLIFGRGKNHSELFVVNSDLPIVDAGPGPGVVKVR